MSVRGVSVDHTNDNKVYWIRHAKKEIFEAECDEDPQKLFLGTGEDPRFLDVGQNAKGETIAVWTQSGDETTRGLQYYNFITGGLPPLFSHPNLWGVEIVEDTNKILFAKQGEGRDTDNILIYDFDATPNVTAVTNEQDGVKSPRGVDENGVYAFWDEANGKVRAKKLDGTGSVIELANAFTDFEESPFGLEVRPVSSSLISLYIAVKEGSLIARYDWDFVSSSASLFGVIYTSADGLQDPFDLDFKGCCGETVIPELPPGFLSLFGLLMSGFILGLRKMIYRIEAIT
jgi:hypothetical protein